MISANRADADAGIIDVWNIDTFDSELRGDLDAHAELIRNYMHPHAGSGSSTRPPTIGCPVPRTRTRASSWR